MPAPKFVSIPAQLYETLKTAGERNGFDTASKFAASLLADYGLDTDDVKVVLRVPAEVAKDRELTRAFLGAKSEAILSQLFPG